MNKSQLVDAIARNAKITKVDAKKALDAFIEVTGETFAVGRQDRTGRFRIVLGG